MMSCRRRSILVALAVALLFSLCNSTASSENSSTWHPKKHRRLPSSRIATSSGSSNPWRREKIRRHYYHRSANDNNQEDLYYYKQQRALRKEHDILLMSMGHHDHHSGDYGAHPSLLDYFTDDQPLDMSNNIANDMGGVGESSGITSDNMNGEQLVQQQQQQQQQQDDASNDSMEILLEFIGDDDDDDDENTAVVPAIVENGMDMSGNNGDSVTIEDFSNGSIDLNQGIQDSTTESESSSSISLGNNNTSNHESSSGSVTGSVTTNDSDNGNSNSSNGMSDSTSTSLTGISASAIGISDSTSTTDSSSVSEFDGSDVSEFISTIGGTNSSTIELTNGSSNASSTDSSLTASSATSLTLDQRKAIIESKCQLSIHSRSQAIMTLLGSFVSNPELTLVAQVGPQFEAFVWLVHLDDAILCPPSSDDEEMRKRILQRYTLATVYFAMNGNKWLSCSSSYKFFDDSSIETGACNNAIRFLDASHECKWYGISCIEDAEDDEDYDVDIHYAIEEIALPTNNLTGAIPTEFYKAFDKLRVWNMEKNGGVFGTLSNGVGRLTELEVLMLNDNQLEGVVPFDALMSLKSLRTINLGVNSMSGNATRLCEVFSFTSRQLDIFITDCATAVTCPCCTSCE